MAQIGELFKFLGKSDIFSKYCNDGFTLNEKNEEIIQKVFDDNELIENIFKIIDDETLIKNKMDTIIGQKRKGLEKKQAKPVEKQQPVIIQKDDDEETEDNEEETEDNEEEKEEEVEFKHKPFNLENVVWLNKYTYLERIGLKMRLVTTDFELYY